MIHDISPALSPDIAVFPGDTPMTREIIQDIDKGDNITLSALHSTVHLGAHADGPCHYTQGGEGIDRVPLNHYLGRCQVVRARVERAGRVGAADLDTVMDEITEGRLLLRTDTRPDPNVWNDDYAGIEPDLIEALGTRGVITIGVDTPSVDTATSKDLPAHAACARTGIVILEGLLLDDVASGHYELIALPLKLVSFDASPVRAILRDP